MRFPRSAWRAIAATLLTGALLAAASPLFAQSPDYILSVTTGSGNPGDNVLLHVLLDNSGGPMQGWSFGACHDESQLALTDASSGSTTQTVQSGAPPDFVSINYEFGGATMGVVIDFFAVVTLAPGTGYEILDLTYTALGAADTFAPVALCPTLGAPPVVTTVVVDGVSIPPTTTDGGVQVLNPNEIRVGSAVGLPGGPVVLPVQLTNIVPVDAVQVSLAYDPAVLTRNGVVLVGAAAGAEFFAEQATPAGELVFGLVMDFLVPFEGQEIPPGDQVAIAMTHWVAALDAPVLVSSPVSPVDGLGDPPIENLIIVDGVTQHPSLVAGAVELVTFNPFVRGDCNLDGVLDIADGVFLITFLFSGGAAPVCDDACDLNDDGALDVTDPIYVWNYVLIGGPAPLPPYPTADLDPTTGDGIGCDGDADDL